MMIVPDASFVAASSSAEEITFFSESHILALCDADSEKILS